MQRSPRTPSPGPTATPATSNATCAPSREAVENGAAAAGEPWQYYDLGHGFCSYTFFEQCPHRMACAKCDFYTPKDSSKALLLEAKDNLQRMLAAVPSPTTSEPPSTTAK